MSPHIVKVLWLWLASKMRFLVVAVDETFYLILDIQDLEHAIGMLVCLSVLTSTLYLQDTHFCMHWSGPKCEPWFCPGLQTISSTLGPV